MFDNEKFLKAITESFRNYQKFGVRSNKKLLPLHKFVADTIKEFANDYKFHYYEENGEFKISGKYYNKDVDIVLTKNNSPILGVGVKFITSNYKQNSNNYCWMYVHLVACYENNSRWYYLRFVCWIMYYRNYSCWYLQIQSDARSLYNGRTYFNYSRCLNC